MTQELKNKFNELITELQSTDMDKISALETELGDMVEKTKQALDLLRAINPNYLVAQHMKSANTKSAEWHELDLKSKIEPVMPPKLMTELKTLLQNESNVLLSCLVLGLGNGFWIEYLKAFEQYHSVDFYPHLPKELAQRYQTKFLSHFIHVMLDPNFQYTNLDMVPNDEVGYMFSWDFLPYFTVPQIEMFFRQINDKMIKGSKGLFHFANADNKQDFELIKQGYYQYCDQETITQIIFDCTNFDIEQVHTDIDCCSYLKFKKPGEIDWKKQEWWRYNLLTKRDPEVKMDKPKD
tara:strand:- start:27 stop:908 length:882 start_codon:yes stop_codon:yes gene_type:complete